MESHVCLVKMSTTHFVEDDSGIGIVMIVVKGLVDYQAETQRVEEWTRQARVADAMVDAVGGDVLFDAMLVASN